MFLLNVFSLVGNRFIVGFFYRSLILLFIHTVVSQWDFPIFTHDEVADRENHMFLIQK